ncbi:MAG TPA: OsmC family protein [Actinomycetota bacterium]|jgi:uncharacterized OsmC-like protein|nr:OsmC family protein [Actinomycetota bacterium]
MSQITIRYEGNDRLRVGIRGHELISDQPIEDGGEDAGPSPTELFVGSLAACIAFYAERYLRRHSLPSEGLQVVGSFGFAQDRPARVGTIRLRLVLPPGVPVDRHAGLLAVVEHCTVHNTLRQAPEVEIRLEPGVRAA